MPEKTFCAGVPTSVVAPVQLVPQTPPASGDWSRTRVLVSSPAAAGPVASVKSVRRLIGIVVVLTVVVAPPAVAGVALTVSAPPAEP